MTSLSPWRGADAAEAFTAFMREVQPRVVIALTASFGPESAGDATAGPRAQNSTGDCP